MRSASRRFGRDERGLAAIEFAILLPVLLLFYFGAVEMVSLFQAQRRLAHVAATIADITAQGMSINDTQLSNVFDAGAVVMLPFSSTSLKERVTSLQADSSGNVTVGWTANRNYGSGAAASVPSGYLAANESVIVADVGYDYTSPLRFVIPGVLHFQDHAYFRPRQSAAVAKD
jgi:Flp pilus assembly protein TadG